jgi:prepilin-type N-terminal cleavage/methylation domain-containing protein
VLQRLRAARDDEKGFTLIELLIVIVILGVLAGIVVFSVQFISTRGEKAACQTEVKTVEVAVEAYYAQEHGYPGTTQVLVDAHYLKDLPATAMTIDGGGKVTPDTAC